MSFKLQASIDHSLQR